MPATPGQSYQVHQMGAWSFRLYGVKGDETPVNLVVLRRRHHFQSFKCFEVGLYCALDCLPNYIAHATAANADEAFNTKQLGILYCQYIFRSNEASIFMPEKVVPERTLSRSCALFCMHIITNARSVLVI